LSLVDNVLSNMALFHKIRRNWHKGENIRSSLIIAFLIILSPVVSTGEVRRQQEQNESELAFSRYQLGVELGGSALTYSFFGSVRPLSNVAFNLGVTFFNNVQLPISLSLLSGGNHNFEFAPGFILSLSKSGRSGNYFYSDGFYPAIGIGYRYWPRIGGFHFRATLYVIALDDIAESSRVWLPWPGLSFGYAF
jgi:hypothetical protein